MSVQQEQTQEFGLQAGFSMFSGQTAHKTDSNGAGNSNGQASPTKESNSPSPVRNIHAAPNSPSQSNAKPVGSHRLFMPIKK